MTEEPDSLVLRMLRRMDEKLDRIAFDVADMKPRLTAVERRIGEVLVEVAGVNARLDRVDARLDRLERRAGLVDAP